MDKLLITLAYKHVALAVMLTLANDFCKQAELPIAQPLTLADIRAGSHVSPPRLMGFGGSLVTSNYFFGFNNGYLANFKKREPNLNSDSSHQTRNKQLAGMRSKIDADGAYQLATNWLIKSGIKQSFLASEFEHRVKQRSYLKKYAPTATFPANSNDVVWLPVFDIEWGRKEVRSESATYPLPLLVVTVFGPTKELVEMHITDDNVVAGQKQPIKDVEKLLAITDEAFSQYDAVEKSQLVAESVTSNLKSNRNNSGRLNNVESHQKSP